MNRVLISLIALLLLSQAAAGLQDYFSIANLSLDATWHGTIASKQGPGARLTSLVARVNLVPNGTYTTDPPSKLENGSVVFEWNGLQPRYDYSISSRLVTRTYGSLFHDDPYPTHEPTTVSEYLKATPLIDYNDPAVRAFAAQAASGETDTLRLAVKLADKVRRTIDYNLTTLNADATYSASEVLARKQGVCDEITVLYIAALRSLGIPARYVTGYAYTNVFDPAGSWEGHSWAEVYIGGQWVPFDLTYDEYIQLSPAHLPLRRSAHAVGSTINYTWYGHAVDMTATQLQANITAIAKGPTISFGTLEPRFAHQMTGTGWNELDVAVTNHLDSFVAPILEFSRTEGLEMPNTTTIIVPPHTTRIARIPVRITQNLRPRYRYTFPVSVQAHGFAMNEAEFSAQRDAVSYPEPTVSNESVSHPDLAISCSNATGLPGSSARIRCSLHNTGNLNLDLRVCADACNSTQLLINERTNLTVPLTLPNGTSERMIRIIGDVRTSTNVTLIGRAPAHARIEANAEGRVVHVRVTSDAPINGTVTVAAGNALLSGPLERTRYTVPSDAFGLHARATVTTTYEDVDGPHTLTASATVSQNLVSYLSSLLSNLLTRVRSTVHASQPTGQAVRTRT